MKKLIIITLLLTACTSKDEQFCKCMEVSEEFNIAANNLLNEKEGLSPEELIALRKKKDTACQNYVSTPGDELLELKKGCE